MTNMENKLSKRIKKIQVLWRLSLGDRHFEEAEVNKEWNSRGMDKKQKVKYGPKPKYWESLQQNGLELLGWCHS